MGDPEKEERAGYSLRGEISNPLKVGVWLWLG